MWWGGPGGGFAGGGQSSKGDMDNQYALASIPRGHRYEVGVHRYQVAGHRHGRSREVSQVLILLILRTFRAVEKV